VLVLPGAWERRRLRCACKHSHRHEASDGGSEQDSNNEHYPTDSEPQLTKRRQQPWGELPDLL